MKTQIAYSLIIILLSGCGGGGGGGSGSPAGSSTPVAAPAQIERLTSYIGAYSSICDNHEIDTATIVRTPGTTDSVNITSKSDYYSNSNCSGALLGTLTDTAVVTAKFVASVNTSAALSAGASPTPILVDQISASRNASTQSVTGSGVVRIVKNGQPQWCIDFGGGNSTCILDMGTSPAQSGANGGLFLQGSDLFVLAPSGSIYSVDQKLKRN